MSINYGFILPHPPLAVSEIGRGKEKGIASTIEGFMEVGRKIAKIKPETIIVYTPHGTSYSDYIHISPGLRARGDFANFGARNVSFDIKYDQELIEAISKEAYEVGIAAGTLGERDKRLDHGTLVPLYFINKFYTDYELIRISLSGLSPIDHYRFGKVITRAADKVKRKVVVIGSGDLSHKLKEDGPYGFDEAGPRFDKDITDAMKRADFLSFLLMDSSFVDQAAQCGLQAFNMLAGNFDKKDLKVDFHSYEGIFGVGYATCSYEVIGDNPLRAFDFIALNKIENEIDIKRENESEYARLARKTVESFVRENKTISFDRTSDVRKGVFVTLKINGKLRACIGTISPSQDDIYREIITNAISAATSDPRFDPVTEEELPYISYSVDVLEKAEKVKSKVDLDPIKYGVIVTAGRKRGLLLPNLEGVDSVDYQLEIALKKAGIALHEKYEIERFEVIRYD